MKLQAMHSIYRFGLFFLQKQNLEIEQCQLLKAERITSTIFAVIC